MKFTIDKYGSEYFADWIGTFFEINEVKEWLIDNEMIDSATCSADMESCYSLVGIVFKATENEATKIKLKFG